MGKYKLVKIGNEWQVVEENNGCIIALIVIAVIFYVCSEIMTAFHMPTEEDLYSDKYRGIAEEKADELLVRQQKKTWESIGFTSNKSAKTYDVSKYSNKKGDIAERTKYQNRTYQVLTGTDTKLSATSQDGKTTRDVLTVRQMFIVTVSTNPKRNWYGTVDLQWRLVDIQPVSISPDIEDVNDKIANWTIPPSKKANW